MAIIQSGSSEDSLTVEALSKAARVILYGVDGAPIDKALDGAYSVAVEVVPTTVTLGSAYFSMFNTGAKKASVNRLELCMGFNGTAAATRSSLSLSRYGGVAASGGTPKTVISRESGLPASTIGSVNEIATTLTTTGATIESPIQLFTLQNQLAATNFISIEMQRPIILNPNEGLIIRAHTAIVAGIFLTGAIYWTES